MAARKPALGVRVDDLEQRVDDLSGRQARLDRSVTQLRRDQRDTRKHMAALETLVRDGMSDMRNRFDQQTEEINRHVDEQGDATKQFVLDAIVDVARQWPASALVIVSVVGAVIAAVGADLIAAALHLPHVS